MKKFDFQIASLSQKVTLNKIDTREILFSNQKIASLGTKCIISQQQSLLERCLFMAFWYNFLSDMMCHKMAISDEMVTQAEVFCENLRIEFTFKCTFK